MKVSILLGVIASLGVYFGRSLTAKTSDATVDKTAKALKNTKTEEVGVDQVIQSIESDKFVKDHYLLAGKSFVR